ncbi:MAG TPA: transposase family protein [Candidatus Limnocylindrales bacterium]|nr:transposase family protein [Candidatus Limnocylindrales bacterium]
MERLLCHHEYPFQKRAAKGLLRAYIEHMTGFSRAQSTRLIGGYVRLGRIVAKPSGRPRFQRHYTPADIALLATVDEAHERLSGPATRHILKREFEVYGKAEFERLAALSNGHLYNLRQSQGYRLRLCQYEKTRPTAVQIGERKKPAPNGQPGFLRIDTVHQGDSPGGKGIYHINAVDEITQWEVVLATPRISEAWLMPLLESILQQFPFVILNFHSDNGSEFINKTVAELLEKLLIEQTKSRPRKSGDNGLVETKNAAIVRKHIGWGHIAPAHAAPINQFYTGFLNPYVNYHRPSAQAEVQIDAKGRKRRLYKLWRTPLETLLSLERPQQFLRPGLSLNALKRVAASMSDTEAAQRMRQAKSSMFEQIRRSA